MPDIVLTTLNARYHHAAFGLRYLHANLDELKPRARILEFTIQQGPLEIVEALLAERPRIIGLGVYIWNVTELERVVTTLRRLRPDLILILGGPELTDPLDLPSLCAHADVVITGEADRAFVDCCREYLSTEPPPREATPRVITAPVPDLASLRLPYDEYTDVDLADRVIYVEASRGCPFTCEFCLSALEIPVRQFPLEPFLAALQRLLDRGCRRFKFVDRTFNLQPRASQTILQFFLERLAPGLFLHFELIPDRLPEGLRALITQFPPGVLQFEVGIQTWNDDVSALISRRQDNAVAEANLRWLREATGVHLHTDLIVGLPGEDVVSFAAGFDRLVALAPQEIQVGILKRLRGTPIIRHDETGRMRYSPHPPYEILTTRWIDFPTMQRLRRFAKTWDLIGNSGNFVETTPWFWRCRPEHDMADRSPFTTILAFSDWLYEATGRVHAIALPRLVELVFRYVTEVDGQAPAEVAPVIERDYRRGGRSDRPKCLVPWLRKPEIQPTTPMTVSGLPKRQHRHRQGAD
jgi:radical SAM superfamily enzyme YgiQ (UPF0313 family)